MATKEFALSPSVLQSFLYVTCSFKLQFNSRCSPCFVIGALGLSKMVAPLQSLPWSMPVGGLPGSPLRLYRTRRDPPQPASCPISSPQVTYTSGAVHRANRTPAPQHGPSPEADNLGKHEVTLKWEKIPKAERNGFITNYTIVYMAYKEIQMNKTVSPDILEYTLKSLQPNTQYNVYIIASTNAGQSNGTSINFSTLKIDKEDIALIIGVVAGCTLLVVVIGMACLHKKHKLKTACWPDVPDPSASSMAEWFQETCKMNPLLKIHLDGILRVENINVLDSFSPTENQTNHIVEYPKNMLESTTRAQNYPYCIQQDFAKPPSPLSYVTAEKGYKSQTPSDAPGEGRSESMSCLIQGLSSEDDETQDTTIDEAFEGGASFNPYLKNSVMTREFIFPVNCVDLKGAGSKQQLMIIAPCQKAGLGKHYVTVDMLGLNVVH